MKPWTLPRWIAHRGAGTLAPENTLAAFRLGAQHGYRAFECDVKLSADGQPFLLHDATLERTSSGQGTAGDLPWAQLSRLDAGSWHGPAYAGEPLPTLDALAVWLRRNGLLLDLEIKPTPEHEEATGIAVAQAVRRLWAGADAAQLPLLSSFRSDALRAAQEAAPELPRALLLDELWPGWQGVAQALDCAAVITNHLLMDAALLAELRQRGWRALCYTVNDEADAQRLIALGIDGLITDAVDRFPPAVG
ncbi:MAG: glycerophosphodiester phosphodiesterase [Rubrivivax sp.]